MGITVTPLSICHFMQIWAVLFPYFFAISAIFGSSSKAGSSGFAQGLSREPNGLNAVTAKKQKIFLKQKDRMSIA